MFFRLLKVSALLLYAHGWALHCSSPITISDQRLDATYAQISSNENGDALLTWLSIQGKNLRLEVSHKTQNSLWSSPLPLSNWEKNIYPGSCFANAKGDLVTTWETEKGNASLLHIAEKIGENPWNSSVNLISSDDDFSDSATGFDSTENLIFISQKPVPYTPKPFSKYAYKDTIPAIVIYTTAPAQIEQSDISPSDEASYFLSDLKIAINKNGRGYAFWVRYAADENLLMCQQIAASRFVSKPEIICSLKQNYIDELKAVLNEKGDILVVYLDDEGKGNIITKIQAFWDKPLLFADEEEKLSSLCPAIDNNGNMMVLYETETEEADVIKAIYKSVDQGWGNPKIFSFDNGSNWNPEVQSDQAGNFIAIWQQEQRGRNSIFGAAFSTATQTWSDPQRLSPQSGSCFGYTYAFWAPGKGYIAWTMSPNGYDQVIQVAELSN